MSLININLDTKTRQTTLTIDGNAIAFKSLDIFARDDDVDFSLRQEIPAENGLVSVKVFRLPTADEDSNSEIGLVETVGTAEQVVAAQAAEFLLMKGIKK